MIQKLLKEIKSINNENYAKVVSQLISILEFDIPEGILYLDFNNKLKLKITYNDNKGFLKFEILEQDKRFWSQDSSEVFSFEAQNGISIISDFYLDIDKAFSYIGLLGSQSLINDGVTVYLPKFIAESETHHINKVIKILEALFDWSYNAPEFNVKEEVKENTSIELNEDNVCQWLKKYRSNKDTINTYVALFQYYSDIQLIRIKLHLNYNDISYELIKSFNDFFNIDKFFLIYDRFESNYWIEIYKKDIK